jgi:hypothetical protein
MHCGGTHGVHRQNHESGGAKTFVAVSTADPTWMLAYYSISHGAIEFAGVLAIGRLSS